jgi:hypothetical protein
MNYRDNLIVDFTNYVMFDSFMILSYVIYGALTITKSE